MSKRVKINFETVNEGKYEIIPPEKVAESNARIKKEMNALRRNRTTEREKALRVLLDNMSADTDEHIAKTATGMACKPCTTALNYRNSFGLISYTACYVLGGLSALN